MLKPADWKFQEKATKWHQLETLVDFDRLYLIAVDKDPETLKKQLQVLMNEILNYFYNTTLKTLNTLQNILTNIADLIESSLIVIEGEVRSPDDTLETLGKRKKSSNKECKNKTDDSNNSLQVSLYIPCVSMNTILLKFTKRNIFLNILLRS